MSEEPPPIAGHEARDRIGKITLQSVHDLGAALTQPGSPAVEPVVVRRGGRHRTVAGLMALIDEALADDEAEDRGTGPPPPPTAHPPS